jgi:hypothetical protein
MFHLTWYILIGPIAGVIVKSGIIESIIGRRCEPHVFAPDQPTISSCRVSFFRHWAAILILFICYKRTIHFPQSIRSSSSKPAE